MRAHAHTHMELLGPYQRMFENIAVAALEEAGANTEVDFECAN